MAERDYIGYSTKAAFRVLHDDISAEVQNHEKQLSERTWRLQFVESMFHHGSRWSVLHWPTCAVILLQCVLLLVAYGCSDEDSRDDWLAVEALIILLLLLANIYLLVWDEKLHDNEIIETVKKALQQLNVGATKGFVWNSANYLNLNTPISPCVDLQWTYRDNDIVNLPTSLLVKGDVIVLRPGQDIMVKCELIEARNERLQSVYELGDTFAPEIQGKLDGFTEPQGRTPLEPQRAFVLETPFVENVRVMLNGSSNKPCSVLENDLYVASTFWLGKAALPGVFFLVLLTGVLRYVLIGGHVGFWAEMFIVLPIHSILPLTPLVLPLLCKLLNLYCAARVITVYEVAKVIPESKTRKALDEFSTASSEIEESAVVNFTWSQVWQQFKKVLSGQDFMLVRTANVAHSLGHLTTLCCSDKKGILSYANPSAEKVFFFTSSANKGRPNKYIKHPGQGGDAGKGDDDDDAAYGGDSFVEVLDLTHNAENAFGVQFDDPSFKRYLPSLKPLGLNILLNTCNLRISSDYTHFADHVTCAALKNEGAVAVVNRRCVCSLAREIGFSDQATDIFSLQDSFGVYQHVSDKSANQCTTRPFSKHRIPMPNVMSVLQQDAMSGTCHLFSQGTADIILECCSEFWNGSEILPLTPSDRKRILDFYHRTSMSSYCSAYAYRPVMQTITEGVPDSYIELPPCQENSFIDPDRSSNSKFNNVFSPVGAKRLESFHSLDSLLDTGNDRDSMVSCYQAQNNQVFIGMVTMQYQAKQDVIQMIDGLEKACIRFVHFSNENELRSRVFSEKMGLEAGWNCHITLLSENTSGRSRHVSDSEKQKSRTSMPSLGGKEIDLNDVFIHRHIPTSTFRDRCSSAPTVICRATKSQNSQSNDLRRSPRKILSALSVPTDESGIKKVHLADQTKTKSLERMDRGHAKSTESVEQREPLVNDDSHSVDSMVDSVLGHRLQTIIKSGSQGTTNTDSLSGLDTLNRAKLPKGIENIRPHLEHVDNVPLLVSLFTDCTSETTREMIQIMQEHGEVVCCLGSSATMKNMGVFVQADVSFALTPLYPHVCTKQTPMLTPWDENDPSPMDVSAMMNSLPCPMSFKSSDNISILELICEARHLMRSFRNSLLLMFSCLLTLTFIQLVASFCLPPPFSGHHILWLAGFVIPSLSLTLMGTSLDPGCITHVPYGKNTQCIKKKYVGQYLKSYILRFVPTSVICILCFGLTLNNFCKVVTKETGAGCHVLFGDVNSSASVGYWNGWSSEYASGFAIAQNWLVFQLVLYFICASVSSVHRFRSVVKRSPLHNKFWCICCPVLLVLEIVYFACDVAVHTDSSPVTLSLGDVPVATLALTFAWPFVMVLLNELIKIYDIKLMKRHQKRERLNFGTKLGMNSPF